MIRQAIKIWCLACAILILSRVVVLASSSSWSEAMIQDFYLRVINFTALIMILVLLVRKPIKKQLEQRIETIKNDLAELETRRANVLVELTEVENKLKNLEENREAILSEFKTLGEKEYSRIISIAEENIQRLRDRALLTISQETNSVKAKLRNEVVSLSIVLAEQLLKQKITVEDQSRLIDEYLIKVQ